MFKIIRIFLLIITLQLALNARDINIDNILTTAKKSDKHLLVWLHKTGCGYCENMREFTLENDTVSAYLEKNFIFVHINVNEKDNVTYQNFTYNGREFAQDVGYDFYPASLFFNHEEEIELAEVGFIDSEKEPNEKRFYKMLNFMESKSYKNIDYEDYIFKTREEF